MHTCTHFSAVDLKPGNTKKIQSNCIVHPETIGFMKNEANATEATELTEKREDFSLAGFQQKTLDPNGYK